MAKKKDSNRLTGAKRLAAYKKVRNILLSMGDAEDIIGGQIVAESSWLSGCNRIALVKKRTGKLALVEFHAASVTGCNDGLNFLGVSNSMTSLLADSKLVSAKEAYAFFDEAEQLRGASDREQKIKTLRNLAEHLGFTVSPKV